MQEGRQQQEPTEATQERFNAAPERRRNLRPSGRGGCQDALRIAEAGFRHAASVFRDQGVTAALTLNVQSFPEGDGRFELAISRDDGFEFTLSRSQTIGPGGDLNGISLPRGRSLPSVDGRFIYAGIEFRYGRFDPETNTLQNVQALEGAHCFSHSFDQHVPLHSSPSIAIHSTGVLDQIRRVVEGNLRILQACPNGYVQVPGNSLYGTDDFCVMKYHAKIWDRQSCGLVADGGLQTHPNGVATLDLGARFVPRSAPDGRPWVHVAQTSLGGARVGGMEACAAVDAELLSNDQWMTIARNIEAVPTNWTGGAVGTGGLFRGHTGADYLTGSSLAASADDSDGYFGTGATFPSLLRRTFNLDNGQVIWDLSGNVYHVLSDRISGPEKPWNGRTYADEYPGLQNTPPIPSYDGDWWQQWTWYSSGDYGILSYDRVRPSNSSWNSAQNVGSYLAGRLDGNETYAFVRGGIWYGTTSTGIFNLTLHYRHSGAVIYQGFRCSKPVGRY
jgi:hypothetical protein